MASPTVASKVPFVDLCKVCEKIAEKQGNEKKRNVLRDFISKWRDFHTKLHKGNETVDSFHPAMRLLLPQLDKERGAYGIKENTLAKLYIDILSLNKESSDAQKLLNYKVPKTAKGDAGDFAVVAYYVLKNRCPDAGSLTVKDVNEDLDAIALNNAAKKKDLVKQHLLHLLRNTSAMEQKWLIRMIMKELRFGLSESSILNGFHPDAKDLYDVTNNLVKVCASLHNPNVRLHEIEITLFSPFRPMLAERTELKKVENLMGNQKFFIEIKYDGERVQLHKKLNEYKYFSRGGNEYTHSYGANSGGGSLTPYITNAFNVQVKECILDGEMLGYNPQTKCLVTKAESFDVKFLQDHDDYQPCYYVFDILLYNEEVLSNFPLRRRLEYLEKIFKPVEGRLHYSSRKEGLTKQDAIDSLNSAIDEREEGIVLKNADSIYRPNVRKGGWVKMKPDYVDELTDHLNLVIVGGYFGEGYRRGMISHFLLAVAVPAENKDEHPSVFHSICKVASGYTKQVLYELCQKLKEFWHPYDKRRPPKSVLLASGHKERPDVWIEPSKSQIVQVKAAEVVESTSYKAGYTLRFPRVETVRYDKPWYECMTTTEFEEIRKLADGKLASRHLELPDEEGSPKKRRVGQRQEQPVTVAPQFLGIDTTTVKQVSQIFKDKEFYVANGSHPTKSELEKLIVEHGGSIVQNPRTTTFCVLAHHLALRVNNIIKSKLYNIVKVSWLERCLQNNTLEEWMPLDMFHTAPETAVVLEQRYDRFGDSYREETSPTLLKALFSTIHCEKLVTQKEIAEIEHRYFPSMASYGLFRICTVYLDLFLTIEDESTKLPSSPLDLTRLHLKLHGATILQTLNEATHVVVHCRYPERIAEFKRLRQKRDQKFHLVTEKWVTDSIEKGFLLHERSYEP